MVPQTLLFFLLLLLLYDNRNYFMRMFEKAQIFFGFIRSSQNKKNMFLALYAMASILCLSYYLQFKQKWNKTLVQISKNSFELTYSLQGNVYKTLIYIQRGPKKLLMALDQNNDDITNLISMYLGPNNDFHHNKFTPDFFDKDSITFHLSNGEEKIFTRYQLLEMQTS